MIIPNIKKSLLRFCADYAETWDASILTVENFDAHADEQSMPMNDLVGISSLSLDMNGKIIGVRVMIGVSTLEDTNLFRLDDIIAPLFEALLPEKSLQLYDAVTGDVIGKMVVEDGTRLTPVSGGGTRPVQFIMVSMSATTTT